MHIDVFIMKLKSPSPSPPLSVLSEYICTIGPHAHLYNWSCRDGCDLYGAIWMKYDTAVWSHWLKAIESWINWAVRYSDRMCPGQRSPPAQTGREACVVKSAYAFCFMKCDRQTCSEIITCAELILSRERTFSSDWLRSGIPFPWGESTFLFTAMFIPSSDPTQTCIQWLPE